MTVCRICGKIIPAEYIPGEIVVCKDCEGYFRLCDLTREQRRELNRIVRKQRRTKKHE